MIAKIPPKKIDAFADPFKYEENTEGVEGGDGGADPLVQGSVE